MKKISLISLLLIGGVVTFAQKKPPKDSLNTPLSVLSEADDRAKKFLPQYSPLSPNASSVQKMGDYQVNLATGIPSIPIPLLTIKNGGLSVPITLNYHAGGFKLNEMASWVGWGFSLDIGASMNRTVQGLNDDHDGGSYLTNLITASRDFCYNSTDFNYGQSVKANTTDTKPDIFSYSIPSKNGKFLLGQNGATPFKIPDYPVQINYSGSPTISNFNLVDDSGVQYVFGSGESQSVISGASTQTYVSSWLISQIKSPNSDDAINYTYQSGGSQYLTERQWVSSLIYDAVPSSGGHFTNSTSSTPAYTTVSTTIGQINPQTITYTNGEVEFIQSNVGERLDLTNSHYLKQINVYNYEEGVKKLNKSIQFTYSYFSGIRLKLDKITLKDANGTAVEEYIFDYWTNTISWNEVTDNEKKDFFGYYNGKPNTHLIPVGSYNGVLINGGAANRSTVDTYMKEGVLKRITFPTKGYTEFDYETNKYNDGTNNVFAGGLRVKSIKSYAGTNSFMKRYEYSSSAGAGIGRLTTNWTPTNAGVPTIQHLLYDDQAGNPNSFGSANQASFTQSGGAVELNTMDAAPVYYTTVTEYFEDAADSIKNGRNVYTFDFDNDIILNAPTYQTRIVKPWKRGNLLTKTTYDSTNNVVASLSNQYQEHQVNTRLAEAFVNVPNVYDGFGGATCATGFNTDFPEMVYGSVSYQTGANLIVSSTNQIDNVSSTQSTTYDSNLYVKSTTSNKSYTNHQQIQEYVYPSDPSYNADTEVLEMRSRNMLNVPLESIEKEDLNGTVNTLFKQKTVYTRFTGNNARGLTQNVLPKEIWLAATGGTLEKRVEYTQYDSYGNPTEYKIDGIPTTLIWGYANSLLLGQVQNASLATVNTALSTAGITASAFSTNTLSNSQLSTLATFRSSLPQATLVSWFTYRPHIGLSSSIAPNGLRSSFFYDTYNRLNLTQDHENNKLIEYFYQYGTTNKITTQQYRAATTGILLANNEPNFITTHDYFDGLGRLIQRVGEQQSPQSKDIIFSTQTYDKYNRLSKSLTVFPSDTSNGDYVSNGTYLAQSFYGDAAPYTSPFYESSPLNRLRSSFGLGSAWQVAGKKVQYFDESAGTDVRYYTVDASGNIILNGTYPDNSLYKKRLIDEQGNTSIEIKDRQGRLVQKQQKNGTEWLTTYYINDGLGRVLAILQPETFALNSGLSQGSADWLNGVFFYKYDSRGRVVESYVPNGGYTYSVYDKADRMVLSQDAHQATTNLWTFLKYDGLNRNILSGELSNNASRNSLQSQFDAHTTLSETFDASKPQQLYYSNASFPFSVDSSRAIVVNYYDTYTTWRSTSFEPILSHYNNSTGLLTGIRKRFTQNNQWLTEAFYHDSKNRNVERKKENLQGSIESLQTVYRFFGGVYSQTHLYAPQSFGKGSIYYSSSYEFDFVERKKSNSLYLSLPNSIDLSSNVSYTYNEIGQLVTKKLQPNRQYQITNTGQNYINRPPALSEANTQDIANKAVIISPGFTVVAYDSTLGIVDTYLAEIDTTHANGLTDALQTINYGYHIRGQLNCINCRSKQVRIGNKENDLFSMKLDFEGDKRYYDGNISKQTWKNPLTSQNQVYKHFYDGISRLTKSTYSGGVAGTNYSLDTVRYSPNGNILQLKRHTIDDLSYIYNRNQLLSVADGGTIDGFKDGNAVGNDYGYWANGSLKFDKNKSIDSIVYHSYLRKVSRVKFTNGNWVNFYYDGSGTLLKRKLSNGDEWIYRDDLLIKNGNVYQINHDEGRVIYDSTAAKWVQEFDYRDHQGNLRLSFRDSLATPVSGVYKPPVITQIDERDPTGLTISGLNYSHNNKNNFGFIDRETFTETGWIDLNNRFFMPELMRFGQVDKMAHTAESWSCYHYGYNNPLRFSDPDGNESTSFTYSDGYGTMDSRNSTGSVGFSGSYQNSGAEEDPPKRKLSGLERTAAFGFGVLNTVGAVGTAVYIGGTDGVGAVAGGYVALAYTVDHAATNFTEAWTGEAQETNGSKLLQAAGVSKNTANNTYNAAGLLMMRPVNVTQNGATVLEEVAVHGNSLKNLKPTWGYKLYSTDGTFLKNGITSKLIPEARYTQAFMKGKYMVPFKQFPNRLGAYQWEYQQNQILRGPLNLNMH